MSDFITQIDNGFSCEEIFPKLKDLRDAEKDLKYQDRSSKSKIYNRFSGEYFSPTFIKTFLECPARTFVNNCLPRQYNEVANFGSCVHKVFERIVTEEKWNKLDESVQVAKEEVGNFDISESRKNELGKIYLKSFMNATDYLNPSKKFPYDKVSMFPEFFSKSDLAVFDIPLGPCFTLMDRLDVRDEGIFIIDYKTGKPREDSESKQNFISSYVDQFIVYSWQVEKIYGVPATGAYAYIPYTNSYVEFPINSLKLQSMLVEKIMNYYEEIKKQRAAFFFEERLNNNCKYCSIKNICNAYNKTNNKMVYPIDLNKL